MPEYDTYTRELEQSKHLTSEGREYWYARDIQGVLCYERWESFADVIGRAIAACEVADVNPDKHFRRFPKMVGIGSGAQRQVEDWYLSRYACYLVAMNADSTKEEVAFAQTYFAIQTHRQEQTGKLLEVGQRRTLRARLRTANKGLATAAQDAGVERFAIFQDAGIRTLYGNKGKAEIVRRKNIPPKEDWFDRMGSTELAAHFFRATQTKEKLQKDNVNGERPAIETHARVGTQVRAAMLNISGVPPEDLPASPSLKKVAVASKRGHDDRLLS